MRYIYFLVASFLFFSSTVSAQWQKINDVDYVWGPFTIYNISLFSETGKYEDGTRPVMLTLKYMKPVDGRDFAISLARSWSNLGITLPDQEKVVDRLRKIMPKIKKGDSLSYIALEDKGYFVLNNTIIAAEFNQDFNNAVVSIWLDPRVEVGRALLSKQKKIVEQVKPSVQQTSEPPQKPTLEPVHQVREEPQSKLENQEQTAQQQTEKATEEAVVKQENEVATKADMNAEVKNKKAEETVEEARIEQTKAEDVKVEQIKAETPKADKNDKPQDEEVEIWEAVDPVFLYGEVYV